jgi:sn-glycerol 3-phosphate transport system substrate-binding protein
LQPVEDLIATAKIDTTDYVDSLINEGTRRRRHPLDAICPQYPVVLLQQRHVCRCRLAHSPRPGLNSPNGHPIDEIAHHARPTQMPAAKTPVPTVAPDTKLMAFAHPNSASYVAWLFRGVIWQHKGNYSDPDFTIRIQEETACALVSSTRQRPQGQVAYNAKDIGADFLDGLTATTMAAPVA